MPGNLSGSKSKYPAKEGAMLAITVLPEAIALFTSGR
jgi:hypothetical protein